MEQRYKILFSDIGGVLLSNGWGHLSREAAAKKFGVDYEEMDVLHDFIFNVYEMGKISLDVSSIYPPTTMFDYDFDAFKTNYRAFSPTDNSKSSHSRQTSTSFSSSEEGDSRGYSQGVFESSFIFPRL